MHQLLKDCIQRNKVVIGIVAIVFSFVVLANSCTIRYNFRDGIKSKHKDHFPAHTEKVVHLSRTFTYKKGSANNIGAIHYLYVKDSLGLLGEYLDSLRAKSLFSFRYTDSCLVSIPRPRTILGSYENPKFTPCDGNEVIPVPELFEFTSATITENDYELFVLELESGAFLGKKRLYGEAGLPDQWKHGYTKGFGISNQTDELVFWIEFW